MLFALAAAIIVVSLWYTNRLVREIAMDERQNIRIWANAIRQKAELVNYTTRFFEQIREEEQKRAEILATAYRNFMSEDQSQSLEFYRRIMEMNTTIPVILTFGDSIITSYRNIDDPEIENTKFMTDSLKVEFSTFDPIRINYTGSDYGLLYFKESKIYTELRTVLDDLILSFFSEVAGNSASVPVVITDSTRQNIFESGNVDKEKLDDPEYVKSFVDEMAEENDPIEIELPEVGKTYIFYMDSDLLTQIMYYPYVQFMIIGLFLFIAYLLFSMARKAEQNLVWIGMSKETAHQLGTPLSSLMAWLELLKMKGIEYEGIKEMEKDINRLEIITDRFSKIGSPANLEIHNVIDVIYDSVDYLKPRTSSKINYNISPAAKTKVLVPLNKHLFEWVIENLCKNAVDAMNSVGSIFINIMDEEKQVVIDVRDTGKGIHKSHFKSIFNPGYTSKKRGWGLGLSLSKRIIHDYHKGKIFVRSSVINSGTVIRIVLKK